MLKDLESKNLSYIIVREFLSDFKVKFSGENYKIKITNLKKIK